MREAVLQYGWVLSFFIGCFFTKYMLAPRYCPRCNYYMGWLRNQNHKKDGDTPWTQPK